MIPNRNQTDSLIETLSHWVNINSHSFNINGIESFKAEVEKYIKPLQATQETIPTSPHLYINKNGLQETFETTSILKITQRPEAPFKILLCGHLDTVFEPKIGRAHV